MSYRVIVERIETILVTQRNWQRVADSGNPRDSGAQYEYVDLPGCSELRQTKILEQFVEELDLAAVIKAINGL